MSLDEEYMYSDRYLVVFRNGDNYVYYEANKKMEIDNKQMDYVDDNELSDKVNDICCGENVYTLIFNNPNGDPVAYSNFLNNI